ncbi:uncharacterized protein LOC111371132 [Olea europaea var. sylvestris]|uniref:uncharacterized protein LOC111371132 n=1 Tax=Olea europaea var. sylvestris TaxID=158386 RepID=UPI000C1D3B4F|nr:uncharacterized protein LOC111371132 [Olea europaea var. sylvestris]
MQILQWLFKIADEHPREPNSSHTTKKQGVRHDQKVQSRDVVVFTARKRHRKRVEKSKLNCNNLNLFYIFRKKDIAKACFYHFLNLKRLGSFRRRQQHSRHPMKMKKEDFARGLGITHKTDSGSHVGNKVLPITDTAKASTTNNMNEYSNVKKKEKSKGDKNKTVSKMKELLKWAAAAKSEKGGKYIGRKVLQFRNRAALKAEPDDDQLSKESPKISFRWDLESCSTTASSASASGLRPLTRYFHFSTSALGLRPLTLCFNFKILATYTVLSLQGFSYYVDLEFLSLTQCFHFKTSTAYTLLQL